MLRFALTSRDLLDLLSLVDDQELGEAVTGIRDLSGWNNNQRNPAYAAADQPFLRLTESRYGASLMDGNFAINPITTSRSCKKARPTSVWSGAGLTRITRS